MKIIVCGAGSVGIGIAKQLVNEDNNVTIIDQSEELINEVSSSLDVSAYVGFPSHPAVLENAGIADADMVIAVTGSDEVNMIICEVAHALFNVPVKLARIRHQNYLQPIWKDLYRHDHLPIDYIISPEKEVANAVINRLHVPGAMDCIPMLKDKMKAVEVRCNFGCPVSGVSIGNIRERFGDIKAEIVAINRKNGILTLDDNEKVTEGDEIFFIADNDSVPKVMEVFGHEEKEARRVVIIGGGNIGYFIAEALEKEEHKLNIKLIEVNKERADLIASGLEKTTVINGSALEQEVLDEVNISLAETVIVVTNDDEVNIISSLLSRRAGCSRVFTLLNKGRVYGPLISSLGIDVVIDPREMTVSGILQHIRRGKVSAAYSVYRGLAELIEADIITNSAVIGKTIGELQLPEGVSVSAILRGEETLIPNGKTTIAEDDRVLVFSEVSQLKKVDKIFSARLDYF